MAENFGKEGCPQKDSAEHEEYAGVRRSFRQIWEERDNAQPEHTSQCITTVETAVYRTVRTVV